MKKFYLSDLSLSSLDLPLRLPFATALGEKKASHNLAVYVTLAHFVGYGEASESLAMPQQTQAKMRESLMRIREVVVSKPVKDLANVKRICRLAWEMEPHFPTAVAAFECALFDAYCKSRGQSLWQFFGAKRRTTRTSYTISVWPPSLATKVTREVYEKGFRQLKVKVSGDMDQDIKRVRAVFQSASQGHLWVDANQAFSVDQALKFLAELGRLQIPILLFEQPLPKEDWDGLAELRAKSRVPIALDESVQTASDARWITKRGLADILNIKLAKSGLTSALEIMRIARESRLKLMIGCMAESARGLWPSVALACGSGAFDYVDLDSHLLVDAPIENDWFTTEQGQLIIQDKELSVPRRAWD